MTLPPFDVAYSLASLVCLAVKWKPDYPGGHEWYELMKLDAKLFVRLYGVESYNAFVAANVKDGMTYRDTSLAICEGIKNKMDGQHDHGGMNDTDD